MRTPRRGLSLVELLLLLVLIVVLAGLVLCVVQRAREASNRTACLSKLRQIILASHNFQ